MCSESSGLEFKAFPEEYSVDVLFRLQGIRIIKEGL
jgi:hypothetical protein